MTKKKDDPERLCEGDPSDCPHIEQLQMQHLTLRGAVVEALDWCEQDAKNEDGHPTQQMLENRVKRLRHALRQAKK